MRNIRAPHKHNQFMYTNKQKADITACLPVWVSKLQTCRHNNNNNNNNVCRVYQELVEAAAANANL